MDYILGALFVASSGIVGGSSSQDICRSRTAADSDAVHNTSRLLDMLLRDYDKRLRPGFGENPTIVDVNLNIRSMGPISDIDMAYQMDCYFRQSWVDTRLEFSASPLEILPVSVNILQRIWKPDTSFFNGKQSYLHTITTPNKLLRINRNGRILYSMRITIKATCPMHLENFPMDTQSCPLQFGSHGYTTDDVVYLWTNGNDHSIKMASDMTLSQFDLIAFPANNVTHKSPMGEHFSTLSARFILRRHMGYFLINVYVPCSLLVIISWVGFWINREATADRIALGVMTVLTMAFLGIENRRDLPRVPYSTALDYFVGICFAFVLATILQFSGVHFFTKHGSGEVYIVPEETSEEDESDDEVEASEKRLSFTRKRRSLRVKVSHLHHMNGSTSANCASLPPNEHNISYSDNVTESCKGERSCPDWPCPRQTQSSSSTAAHTQWRRARFSAAYRRKPEESCLMKLWQCLIGSAEYRTNKLIESGEGKNSVSILDKMARFVFPATFLVFNVVYWKCYVRDTVTSV